MKRLTIVVVLTLVPFAAAAQSTGVLATKRPITWGMIFALLFLMLGPIKLLGPFAAATKECDRVFRLRLATAPSYSRLPPSLSPACLASKCSTTLPSALLIHLSSEERIDALSRKWFKLSAGGNLEHKLEPLFGNALRLARKGSPAPTAKRLRVWPPAPGQGRHHWVKLTQGCPRMIVCIDDQAGILGREKTPLIADITRSHEQWVTDHRAISAQERHS
jgi:hypothetical protein